MSQYKWSDSLSKIFDERDLEELRSLMAVATVVTAENIAETEPLQKRLIGLMTKLPKTEDENGVPRPDVKSEQGIELFKMARTFAMDAQATMARYSQTWAKIPGPTGAMAWANVATLVDERGAAIKIDPTKFKVMTVSGATIDPRVRFKTDDPDFVSQVVKPLREKFTTCVNTTISRLKTKTRMSGARAVDWDKSLAAAIKPIESLYKRRKKEEFAVKAEAELKKALKAVQVALGM